MARQKQTDDYTLDQQDAERLRSEKEILRDRKIFLANCAKALQDRSCRALVWEILSLTGVYNVSVACDNTTFFSEGKRSVGIDIISLLEEVDPALYPRMILDNAEKDNG